MSIRSKILAAAAAVSLAGISFSAAAMFTAGAAQASTPLPAYPATTTLDLASPYCITDDVIMNDPLDSISPITDTYGGTDGVISHATPPVTYYLWYLDSSNKWVLSPPPGTQINPTTGVISAYGNGASAIPADIKGTPGSAPGSVTYTVRDHGKDAVGAVGTEQFQLTVNVTSTSTSVSYEGNTFNNADGALTIQLNGGSTTSTALTLSAIASSLHIPEVGGVGSTPVTFALVNTTSGWHLSGGSSTAVLTGTDASDPELTATTADHDVVFFTLSGISTTSAGVFYINNDANPCVNTTPPPAPVPTPTSTSTATPPPPAPVPGYGDFVNRFGNGWDVYQQYAWYTPAGRRLACHPGRPCNPLPAGARGQRLPPGVRPARHGHRPVRLRLRRGAPGAASVQQQHLAAVLPDRARLGCARGCQRRHRQPVGHWRPAADRHRGHPVGRQRVHLDGLQQPACLTVLLSPLAEHGRGPMEVPGRALSRLNPAYTSIDCHLCGRRCTRPQQDTVVCPVHGAIDADVNGARNIAFRAGLGSGQAHAA